MADKMSISPLVSFMAWTFVPRYATSLLHNLYYNLTVRAGEPKPQPGTALYIKHYKRIYTTLILLYLGYTVLEVFHDLRLNPDYYTALGVTHLVDEKILKSRMRRLAAQYHPDKVGSTGPHHDYYVFLQGAADVLLDPVRRFAYDRYGPEVIQRGNAALSRQAQVGDWVRLNLYQSGPSYVASVLVLGILGLTGHLQYGRFWRYWGFASLILLEVWVATRPYTPWLLWRVINPFLASYTSYPPLLPFQFLALARKLTFNLFIAISQLGPMLEPPGSKLAESGKEVELQQLARLEQIAKLNEVEAGRLLALDIAPFVGDEGAQRELKANVREWLVQNTIRADPEVRQRVASAIEARQGDSVVVAS